VAKPYGWIQHIPFAFFLIEKLKPTIFVELGTHSGNSYFSFCQAVEELKIATKCYAVDTWEGDEHASFYDKNVFKRVKSINDEHFNRVSSLLKMTFVDALAYFNDQTVDLLHIDGLHTYEAVKHDFDTWLPKLSKQGVVIFHDTNVRDRGFGVWKFWEELREKYISFDFVHGNGLGVLCVGDTVDEDFVSFCKEANHNPYYRNFFSTLGNRILLYQELDDTRKELELNKSEIKKRENELEIREKFISKRNEEYEKLKKDTESFRKIIRENDKVIANFDVRISNHKTTIDLKNEAIKKLEERLEKHKAAMSKRDSAIVKLEERTKQLREDNYQGKEGMLLLEKRLLLHQDTISKKNDKIQDLQNSLENYKTALAHKDEKIRGIELTINQKDVLNTQLTDKIQRIVEELDSKKNEIEDQKSILRELEYENSIKSKEIDGLTKKIDELNSSLLIVKNEFESSKTILVSTSNQLRERETTIAEFQIQNSELQNRNSELQNQNSELQNQNSELQNRNSELQNQNSELQDIANQTIRLKEQLEESEKVLKERLRIVEKEVISKDEVIFNLQHSYSWRLTKPIRLFGHLLKNFLTFMVMVIKVIGNFLLFRVKQSKQEWNNYKAIQVINKSDYFDRKWYLMQYPDVAKSKKDPVIHYVRRGAIEGRNPNKDFSTSHYLKRYPDVLKSDVNPLVHYILFGQKEGRVFSVLNERRENKNDFFIPNRNKLKGTVMVITWDVGHNPLGRSYIIAEIFERLFEDVIIVGFQFPKYGKDIWEPLRDSSIPILKIPCETTKEMIEQVQAITNIYNPNLVVACKTRFPSMYFGVLLKHKYNCPLVVDIDDHELSFVGATDEIPINKLEVYNTLSNDELTIPYGKFWTIAAQDLRKFADFIIVSNKALEREYGGLIIPHVRNERVFDPKLYDKNELRKKYNLKIEDKLVLFFGTPRLHKGLDVLAKAIGSISLKNIKLLIVGETTDRSVTNKLNELSRGKIIFMPNQPFSIIPEIVSLADVVCLPQDTENPISRYQLPAKAIDAIGMGIPLLVTETEPLKDIIEEGLAGVITKENISDKILLSLSKPSSISSREIFLEKYSYDSAARNIFPLVQKAIALPKKIGEYELKPLTDFLIQKGLSVEHKPVPKVGVDYVLFWKQNDTTLYGRRVDMIIDYLAKRSDTRKVIVFDAPISVSDLSLKKMHWGDNMVEHQYIYYRAYEKVLGMRDSEKIKYKVFIYSTNKKGQGIKINSMEFLHLYNDYINLTFIQEEVDPHKSIFIFFPKNFQAKEILSRFKPGYLIADVVDDHRSWPNTTEEQRAELTQNYKDILGNANEVFCNCLEVQRKMLEFNSNIKIIPNGCQLNPNVVVPKNVQYSDFIKGVEAGKKIIGFTGNLESKIDIPLLEKLAERFPNALIVLIGSTHSNPQVLQLKSFQNVFMPGIVPYEEIGAWISKFSVGILPHLSTELTKNMNPLKAYVYLNYNLPVVSTKISNIPSDLKGFFVTENDEEFINMVEKVLTEGKHYNHSDFVKTNSWQARFTEEFDRIVKNVISL